MTALVRYPPISGYALIGNCRTGALVSDHGSIDWLCLPRFDSPSIFGALLDAARGGRFQICPAGPFCASRRYIGESAVLETTFRTGSGVLRLVDFMPAESEPEKRRELRPDHLLVRLVECVQGEVDVEVCCAPRPDYAREMPHLMDRGPLGLVYSHGRQVLVLQGDVPLSVDAAEAVAAARVHLSAGDRRAISLAYSDGLPAVLAPPPPVLWQLADRSVAWWEHWIADCAYDGPFLEAVRRSALTLKLLTFAPSGAIVAAPTTSLPEKRGGVRNWDYRYCWLRDASLTVRALLGLGYTIEAGGFLAWLLHATRLTWPELRVLYDVYGGTDLRERTLPELDGYAGSRPVRIGNLAQRQVQLDVYGEVADAALRFVMHGGKLDRRTGRVLVGLGETACILWREPDHGIWEARARPRHHTFSKVMCWIALDRLAQLHDRGHIKVPVERFRREADAIRRAVEEHGFNERLGSYVTTFEGDDVDASLLQLANFQYADAASPRMIGTYRRVRGALGEGPLLYRYLAADGLPPGEGAFGICTFWAIECRARAGDVDGAMAELEQLLGYANDVGLFAEEIDPVSGAALGNFPQAFTHIGLINAAITIARKIGAQPSRALAAAAPRERRRV
ncbi:MAG TPA: glycoside hydrolase family 15 protein [Longimicrobiales bacterium]|nr:glycoside hydrolase family 15 protein [Longimicrobiales bacterium]